MSTALTNVQHEEYWRLLRTILPDASFCGLVSESGGLIWSSSERSTTPLLSAARDFATAHPAWMNESRGVIRKRESLNLVIAGQGISGSDGTCFGALIVFSRSGEDGAEPTPPATIAAAMRAVSACIARECGLGVELDKMAMELSARYEELNLLYNTDDHVRYFDEAEKALLQAVENTTMYLDVGMTVLSLPAKNIQISHVNPVHGMREHERVLEALAGHFYERVRKEPETVVINGDNALDPDSDASLLGNKMVLRPIYDANGDAEGFFAIVNGPDASDFTNNDSNLLQVMTRKITRIVLASYDPLTGLLSRRGYEHFLEKALAASRYANSEQCVLHVNIDKMHVVNDTGSPHAGDALIQEIASVITKQIRSADVVARLGGDEFGLILADCQLEDGRDFADKLRVAIEAMRFTWDRREFSSTVSIGIAPLRPESEHINEVMSAAEIACGEAKEAGRNRVTALRRDDTLLIRREAQMQWVGRIHEALREGKFRLYSQRIKRFGNDDQKHHAEILLRLVDDDGSILSPGEFIPSAERYNLMPAIDRWVVEQAFRTVSAFLSEARENGQAEERSYRWAINLSGQSMGDRRILQELLEMADETAIPAASICFEVTETAAVNNLADARRFMAALKARGFRFSLDDFGTGVSSFAYLKALPVDYLKIDGSFVREIIDDPVSHAMVSAVNQIGHVMGLETIAEFVESAEIRDELESMGLDYGQGFAIARPIPLEEELATLLPAAEEAEAL